MPFLLLKQCFNFFKQGAVELGDSKGKESQTGVIAAVDIIFTISKLGIFGLSQPDLSRVGEIFFKKIHIWGF